MKNKIKELQDKFDTILVHGKMINHKSPDNILLKEQIDNIQWHLDFSVGNLKDLLKQVQIGE